jgi:hypothetical protein
MIYIKLQITILENTHSAYFHFVHRTYFYFKKSRLNILYTDCESSEDGSLANFRNVMYVKCKSQWACSHIRTGV